MAGASQPKAGGIPGNFGGGRVLGEYPDRSGEQGSAWGDAPDETTWITFAALTLPAVAALVRRRYRPRPPRPDAGLRAGTGRSSSSTARASGRACGPAGRRRSRRGHRRASRQPPRRLRRPNSHRRRLGRDPRRSRQTVPQARSRRRLGAKQWNFLPCGSPRSQAGKDGFQSRGGIDAIGAWQTSSRLGRAGAKGGEDRRSRHRRRLPQLPLPQGRFRRSPDFARKQFASGYDFVKNDPIALDENGHGTHIAGTIGERTNNGIGLTGLASRAKLIPVRVLNSLGRGQSDDIARGIRFAADHHADVINMSFNFACHAKVKPVAAAIRHAHKEGAVLVASVGNRGSEACVSPPATLPNVIGVAGTHRGRLPRRLLAHRR